MEESSKHSERSAKLRDAVFLLEGIDSYRNLHVSVAIIFFIISAGSGVRTFFLLSDLSLWGEVSEYVALMITSICFVLIFPVWILTFFFFMFLLDVMGIKDLRTAARSRLSNLTLSLDELNELRDVLASREWRHGHIFKSVVADMTNAELGI